jgi:hypothetical protein
VACSTRVVPYQLLVLLSFHARGHPQRALSSDANTRDTRLWHRSSRSRYTNKRCAIKKKLFFVVEKDAPYKNQPSYIPGENIFYFCVDQLV